MKWTDTIDIAIALIDHHPDIDPVSVRFTDLQRWVLALPGFDDVLSAAANGFSRPFSRPGLTSCKSDDQLAATSRTIRAPEPPSISRGWQNAATSGR